MSFAHNRSSITLDGAWLMMGVLHEVAGMITDTPFLRQLVVPLVLDQGLRGGLLACYRPVRATRIDPLLVLRED